MPAKAGYPTSARSTAVRLDPSPDSRHRSTGAQPGVRAGLRVLVFSWAPGPASHLRFQPPRCGSSGTQAGDTARKGAHPHVSRAHIGTHLHITRSRKRSRHARARTWTHAHMHVRVHRSCASVCVCPCVPVLPCPARPWTHEHASTARHCQHCPSRSVRVLSCLLRICGG